MTTGKTMRIDAKGDAGGAPPGRRRSNRSIARAHAQDMAAFVDDALAGRREVPIRHGRVHKRAICRMLGITYSTRHSNPGLVRQFERLEAHFDSPQVTADRAWAGDGRTLRGQSRSLRGLEARIATREGLADDRRRQLRQRDLAEAHLLRHGRRLDPFPRDDGGRRTMTRAAIRPPPKCGRTRNQAAVAARDDDGGVAVCGLVVAAWPAHFLLRDDAGRLHRVRWSGQVNALPPMPGEVWRIRGNPYCSLYSPRGQCERIDACDAVLTMPTGRLLIDFMKCRFDGLARLADALWLHAGRLGVDLCAIMERQDAAALAGITDAKGRPVLGPVLAAATLRRWRQLAAGPRIMRWLQARGFSTRLARPAWGYWGADTIAALEDNVFRLLAFAPPGGMRAAFDKISRLAAQEFSVAPYDPRRLVAALECGLCMALDNGHTAATMETLHRHLDQLLGRGRPADAEILRLASERHAVAVATRDADGGILVQLRGIACMERAIADRLLRMAEDAEARRRPFRPGFDPTRLAACEVAEAVRLGRKAFRYVEEQRRAIEMAATRPVSLIVGLPGSGKTTLLRAIVDQVGAQGGQVHQVSLTGKAVRRMHEASGHPAMAAAKFIHRLKRQSLTVRPGDLLLWDEADMNDLATVYALLKHLPEGCRLCFVGDPHRLPPVGAGLTFHVMTRSAAIPKAALREVHRQASETGIPQAAAAIRGRRPPAIPCIAWDPDVPRLFPMDMGIYFVPARPHQIPDVVARAYRELRAKRIADDGRDRPAEVLVLCGKARDGGPPVGVDDLNAALQQVHRTAARRELQAGGVRFVENDPLLFTGNLPDRDLWNGSTGVLRQIYDCPRPVTWTGAGNGDRNTIRAVAEADIDGVTTCLSRADFAHVRLGYVMTADTCPGSRFDCVVIVCQESMALDNAWFYTAVTRARRLVVLVGDPVVFARHVRRPPTAGDRVVGLRFGGDGDGQTA